MPGSRGRNFRGGDLAEGLGLELLRPFAFIAPVPRPEDVGIDAVATLIRRETHRLIAEEAEYIDPAVMMTPPGERPAAPGPRGASPEG